MKKILCALWLLVPLTAVSAAEQGWSYDASFYAWLAGIDGTIGVGRAGDEPIEATFSDLAGFVDFAAAGHFEARSARTVLLADINYVGLADERDAEIAGQTVTVDMDYDQWIIEFAGGYRATGAVDLLIAGRYYMQDTGATATAVAGGAAGGTTHEWGDVFIGARYSRLFDKKWLFSVRGDVGAGGSDFAWFGNIALGYQFTALISAGLGYRILRLDYETGSGADFYKYDVATNGVGMFLRFSFQAQ